jgi:hypothetical protein
LGIVEKTVPNTFIKKDLFGFLDLVAVKPGHILGVQVTSGANHAKRRTKILSHENFDIVRQSGMDVDIHSWRKSAKTKKYELRIESLTFCIL